MRRIFIFITAVMMAVGAMAENEVTLKSYEQQRIRETLMLSNNTNDTIISVKARLMYYDMNGNMLTDRPVVCERPIYPRQTRQVELYVPRECGRRDYYKSTQRYGNQGLYKIEFIVDEYKTNHTPVKDDFEYVEVVGAEAHDYSENMIVISETEWNNLVRDVRNLQQEVKMLQQEHKHTGAVIAQPFGSSNQIVSASDQSSIESVVNAKDVTLANYSQDWTHVHATISFKNNTNKKITNIAGRLIYYDMSGNMLDYYDFTKSIAIEPGMVKGTEVSAYGYRDSWAYFKSKARYDERRYKVKFELKSYKTE